MKQHELFGPGSEDSEQSEDVAPRAPIPRRAGKRSPPLPEPQVPAEVAAGVPARDREGDPETDPEGRTGDGAARRRAVLEFSRPLLLSAGAGTGKTATLVARICHWVLGPGWER